MILINKLFNKNNDNYYTVSNDTSILSNDISILNEKPIVNNKPVRRFNNGFTKFMINMLSIVIWIILTGIIFGSIIALMYYCYKIFNNINFAKSAAIILGAGFGLLVAIITDKINIITNHILDKLENDDDN